MSVSQQTSRRAPKWTRLGALQQTPLKGTQRLYRGPCALSTAHLSGGSLLPRLSVSRVQINREVPGIPPRLLPGSSTSQKARRTAHVANFSGETALRKRRGSSPSVDFEQRLRTVPLALVSRSIGLRARRAFLTSPLRMRFGRRRELWGNRPEAGLGRGLTAPARTGARLEHGDLR